MSTSSKGFSKKELVSILEVIEASQNCVTPLDVSTLLLQAKDLVSADYSICGMGRLYEGEIKDVIAVVNGNYPTEWLDVYFSEKFYRHDPVVRYHKSFSPAQTWSDILPRYDDVESRLVVGNAWDFGLRHGISTSVFSPGSEDLTIFAFAGGKDTFRGRQKEILDMLSLHLNGALLRVVRRGHRPLKPPTSLEEIPGLF